MLTFPTNPLKLSNKFIENYIGKQPNWGPLGYVTYKRTYARIIDDTTGQTEEFWQTCQRVVEGVYNIQKSHCERLRLPWNAIKSQKSAQEMFRRMWDFKFLPPGRGLWMMGTDNTWTTGSAALNNCGFTSTKEIDTDFSSPFTFLMDMSMLGVGVGGDTKGEGLITIRNPKVTDAKWVIPDTREGWVDSVRMLLDTFVGKGSIPIFDYSLIRPIGVAIKGFGGVASGPDPLADLHRNIIKILTNGAFEATQERWTVDWNNSGEIIEEQVKTQNFVIKEFVPFDITSTIIVDLFNFIGKCVVAGNVRRCLPEGTFVHTSDGLMKIEDVSAGMMARTSNGFSEISELVNQGTQEVLTIKTKFGGLECTPKHRVAILTSDLEYGWKKARELVAGDRMIFKSLEMKEFIPAEIIDIKYYGKEIQTYDISVHANEFFAGLGFLVHNTAEIMFGRPDDDEFSSLKQDQEALLDRRWASNNSIYASVGMNYSKHAEMTAINGEPGYMWLENARAFGRMSEPANWKDRQAEGSNPCFTGDTLIAVADGRNAVSIKQLAEEGNDIPVYSVNEKGIVEIKMARNPRLTRQNAELVKVIFDDNSELIVTPDHNMRLLDGTKCHAKDLVAGDSLPRFSKRKEAIKSGGNEYWRISCDTLDTRKDRIFEHRLIAEFNKPDNLEIMTFKDHTALHGKVDNNGEKNPMYGKTHSEKTKKKIGAKTIERCKDPEFLAKLSASHTEAERDALSKRYSAQRREEVLEYHKEQEAKTDLETVWMNGFLHAVKKCETCSEEFVVRWGMRGQSYCNISCANKKSESIANRTRGLIQAFGNRQRDALHNQVIVYKDLKDSFKREPTKKEWEIECKNRSIPYRIRKESTTDNQYTLTSYGKLKTLALEYNHRVKEVVFLDYKENVYNLSVEDNHTVGVVLENQNNIDGIFVFQCAEQTLFNMEICCLVETFPSKHDTLEDYLTTLKYAYLYAKSVTLLPTHDQRTNAVVMRNRRIGCSQSGIQHNIAKIGYREHMRWSDEGYARIKQLDKLYSDWLCIPRSIKMTSIKPSGCRPGTGLITTDRGIFTLNELVNSSTPIDNQWGTPSDVLYAGKENNKITKTYKNGYSQIKRITLNHNFQLESTEEHMWFVKEAYVREKRKTIAVNKWKRTDELLENDILDINLNQKLPLEPSALYKYDAKISNNSHVNDDIIFPDKMSPNLAWLLGYLWGDGALSNSKSSIRFIDERKENLEKVQNIMKELFNLDTTIHKASENRNAYVLEEGSIKLYEWILHNGFNKKNDNKISDVPLRVRTSRKEDIVAFVAGLIDSDGCVFITNNGKAKFCIDTVDKNFASHLQHVLWIIGLPTGRSNSTRGENKQIAKNVWKLSLNSHVQEESARLLEKHSTKLSGVKLSTDYKAAVNILGKVISVEDAGSEYTFDVEVENEHAYYAGSVYSHNTVSLMPGVSPGVHYDHSEYYIRRIRIQKNSPIVGACIAAGHTVAPCPYQQDSMVVDFPIHVENFTKSKDDASMWEQLELVAQMQAHWADNQVSATVTFNKAEAGQIATALSMYESRLKSISFLPLNDHGYLLAPYETITKEQYEEMASKLSSIDLTKSIHEKEEKYCDGDKCEIVM